MSVYWVAPAAALALAPFFAGAAQGKGRNPESSFTCTAPSAETGPCLQSLRLYVRQEQKVENRLLPVLYGFEASLAAPAGQVRQSMSVHLTLFRAGSGRIWGQGGNTPCKGDTPSTAPACSGTRFRAAAEDLFFHPGFRDYDGLSLASEWVLATLNWKERGVNHVRQYMVRACTLTAPKCAGQSLTAVPFGR